MCNHDQIAFLHKDEFFTGAKCINCLRVCGVEDIREALRSSNQSDNDYWCCRADFGEHEENCPNYIPYEYTTKSPKGHGDGRKLFRD